MILKSEIILMTHHQMEKINMIMSHLCPYLKLVRKKENKITQIVMVQIKLKVNQKERKEEICYLIANKQIKTVIDRIQMIKAIISQIVNPIKSVLSTFLAS